MNLGGEREGCDAARRTLTIEDRSVALDEHYAKAPPTEGGFVRGPDVSDTGIGMTPEVQGVLLEPFFTTKEPGKGTGEHGHRPWHRDAQRRQRRVSSEVGKGTTFKVYFPSAEVVESAAARLAARLHFGGETVVLVEAPKGARARAEVFGAAGLYRHRRRTPRRRFGCSTRMWPSI